MKHQTLFTSKDKSKKNSVICCKLLFGALRVKNAHSKDKTLWRFGYSECNRVKIAESNKAQTCSASLDALFNLDVMFA